LGNEIGEGNLGHGKILFRQRDCNTVPPSSPTMPKPLRSRPKAA
jgi:hypothetical protein